MTLSKTLTPKLIQDLNQACDVFSQVCSCECDDVGWCDSCWNTVGGGSGLGPMESLAPENTGCEVAKDNTSD